jgi:bacillithiol synthase
MVTLVLGSSSAKTTSPLMEPKCLRQTLIPGASSLFSDFLYHFERVAPFFRHAPFHPDSFSNAAKEITYPEDRRAGVVRALRLLNPGSPNLDRLAKPGTVAVVTGQQVGLFSGPAYTVYKAVTAAKAARYLTDSGTEAVPVFWLATEDHDLEEIAHAWVFDEALTPSRLTAEASMTGGPVGQIVPTDLPLPALREALGALPFAADVVALVERSYQPGSGFGSAFHTLLREILSELDLIYLDPLLPELRHISAAFLSGVVERVPELSHDLLARNLDLTRAGYHAQVNFESDSSLLFLIDGGKRVPLRFRDGRFKSKDKEYSAADLELRAIDLSPNALLRPVMQDFLLPTVVYVGGPAEVAYMAQAQVIYDKLLGTTPVIFPRNSFTLLDPRSEKLLRRYSLHLPELFETPVAVEERIASTLVPEDVLAHFEQVESTASSLFVGLRADLEQFDPTLKAAAKKAEAKILYQFERLRRKAAREALRRNERAHQEALYLMNLIYPQKHLQERFYSILPFLAKFGLDLPTRLLEEATLTCPDHMVREF